MQRRQRSPGTDPAGVEGGPSYFTGRAILTDASLIVLATVSAYLEYVAFPAQMASYPYNETNISLSLSFLTFQFNATRCGAQTCQSLAGVPALDFFQVFLLALIVVNILRYRNYTRSKAQDERRKTATGP